MALLGKKAQAPVAKSYYGGATYYLYLVAGLAVANTLMVVLLDSNVSLIFGATSALVAAYIFEPVLAVVLTLVIAGILAGLGFMSLKGKAWALPVAAVAYMADAAVAVWGWLIVGDTGMAIDLLVHAVVLYLIVRGIMEGRTMRAAAQAANPYGVPVQYGMPVPNSIPGQGGMPVPNAMPGQVPPAPSAPAVSGFSYESPAPEAAQPPAEEPQGF